MLPVGVPGVRRRRRSRFRESLKGGGRRASARRGRRVTSRQAFDITSGDSQKQSNPRAPPREWTTWPSAPRALTRARWTALGSPGDPAWLRDAGQDTLPNDGGVDAGPAPTGGSPETAARIDKETCMSYEVKVEDIEYLRHGNTGYL